MQCYFCHAEPVFRFVEFFDARSYVLGACCEQVEEQLATFDEWPEDDRRAALDEAAYDLGLPNRVRSGDARLDFKLAARILRPDEQRLCFAHIVEHHRHHDAPVGWKFGIGCWNGPMLVGTLVVGRPVNRNMQARGFHEITRGCTHADWPDEHLSRHAASKLYAAAIAEVKRLGETKLMTYTLEHEDGRSFRHLGFERVWLTKGGSWHTPSRPRTDKAPIGKKWLWVWPPETAKQLREERKAKERETKERRR